MKIRNPIIHGEMNKRAAICSLVFRLKCSLLLICFGWHGMRDRRDLLSLILYKLSCLLVCPVFIQNCLDIIIRLIQYHLRVCFFA